MFVKKIYFYVWMYKYSSVSILLYFPRKAIVIPLGLLTAVVTVTNMMCVKVGT
jgi:hypothetical protein